LKIQGHDYPVISIVPFDCASTLNSEDNCAKKHSA
jgi:hypothetical protein